MTNRYFLHGFQCNYESRMHLRFVYDIIIIEPYKW